MHCNPDLPADVMPVDIAINAIIAAAWDRGLKENNKIEYCNITLPHEKQLTWGQSVEKGKYTFICFSFIASHCNKPTLYSSKLLMEYTSVHGMI